METLGNAFYDIGCCVADLLDTYVAQGILPLRLAYWTFYNWETQR